jgi:hypothetical protein
MGSPGSSYGSASTSDSTNAGLAEER